MVKKGKLAIFTIVILFLCCSTSWAADNSVSLGNEIMESVNKTEKSIDNVVSGNVMNDTKNTIENTGNMLKSENNKLENSMNLDQNRNVVEGYNTTRTTTEGIVEANNTMTMTTTTWMWIILVAAAVVIIAAIWYYATQDNS